MEVGLAGACGQFALKPVDLGYNLERETAPNQCLKMAGKYVKGLRENKRNAVTSSLAQVKNITYNFDI